MDRKKALLVYNAQAGQAKINDILKDITDVLAAEYRELTMVQTFQKGDGERICRERASDYDQLFIVGGDGTVHECINGLMDVTKPPVVGIFPAGTCNDFSRTLGIPQTIAEAAGVIKAGQTLTCDIGSCNKRYFTNFVGLGLITTVSEETNSTLKNSVGKLSYFISALQSLKKAEPFSFALQTAEKVERSGEAVMILAMNGYSLGTANFHLPDSKLDDSLMELYIIQESGLKLLKNMYYKTFTADWTKEAEGIELIRTSSFSLTTAEKMEIDMDGEIYQTSPAAVALLPRKLTFFMNKLTE
ncbi:diacylglycerol/lipid kinase family protein [Halalkalibacter oceani]|uniref:diacylglycerol/lipid kinase family protein n=1 Tax=Halalkalibacter oceani TaxID=1653776 RepID=UPI0033985B8F